MYVKEWIENNGYPKGIVTESDALWDLHDGEIQNTDDWLLKRYITRVNDRVLIVI